MRLENIIAKYDNKTVYRNEDKCIKVFAPEYSKADVFNEALNQARIEQTGLNIPKILEVTSVDGKWALVSEYIEGKTLACLMKEHPENKKEYIKLLVDLQMNVHAKSCPSLNRLRDRMGRKIASTDLNATTRYDLHIRLDEMPRHNKVCHGNFTPENIIITDEGIPYILNWAHTSQGNASADVARTYLLFWLDGDISGAEFYLENFCEKSRTEKRYIRKWMPLVAAAQSADSTDKEREFLMSWVNAVDYDA